MDSIYGYIERITFQNLETGFTIAQLLQKGQRQTTTIVGIMPAVQPGETVRCSGQWKQHLIHGRQFEVQECRIEAPSDIIGIKKYLGSGLIKGIGPTYAARIVEKFGVDTLHIIDQHPDRLSEIDGLGKKRLDKIKSCWIDQKSIREVMIFLQSYGVSPGFAQKIFKVYGQLGVQKIKENPYSLARDIHGIGFKTADEIAKKMGIAQDSAYRIDAGIEHALSKLSDDGHVCHPVPEFIDETAIILEVSKDQIETRLQSLKQEGRIELFELVHEGNKGLFIWIKSLFIAETGIAREIERIKLAQCHLRQIDTKKALDWVQGILKIQLATNQQEAVTCALSEKLHIITGGPGTGKSTITNAILTITEKLTGKIVLAAPTGRAAKRMSEITKKKASTIHSLLEFDFKAGRFKRNRESPLDCDLIIIDEASMIDTYLMYSLLKAIPAHARLILVGDINQLPSVGPGNVLKDIISSRYVSVTMLNEIFRQAAGSRIITNAHAINRGAFPNVNNEVDSDFFFMPVESSEDVLTTILGLVSQRLPKKYGLDPFKDIQVLAPMRRGVIGTENLNVVLQETLNPKANPLIFGGRKFSVGDKVMQIRNNYQREVFNGDIGRILSIDSNESQIVVSVDEREVIYEFSDLDELVLSYAVSIHKFQGSECPCIVMPIHTTHFKLLTRNLLYTGVTRGKRLVVLVGTTRALSIAIHNDEVRKRYTGLRQALIGNRFGQFP
jgi:exodeoxyribonuclease V alpha subunit